MDKIQSDKFKASVDIYRQTKENFSALQIISPFAQLPADAAGDIAVLLVLHLEEHLVGLLARALGQIMGKGLRQDIHTNRSFYRNS